MESDFLTSPADIYPNRRVELENAEICEKTKESFGQLCDRYDDILSKNNQDIGARSHKSRATVDYTPIGVEPHGPT